MNAIRHGLRTVWPNAAMVTLVGLSGCAGATLGSGVGDRSFDRPPYYGGGRSVDPAAMVGHLPLAYQAGATHDVMFDPAGGPGTPVAALLREMNAYLDSLGVTKRLIPATAAPGAAPDVQFGCQTDITGDCIWDDEHDVRRPHLQLAVARPGAQWTAWARQAVAGTGITHIVVLTLEVGQYWTRQKNWRGQKEVELGSNYSVPVPWLTSLETPVSVLQLTGVVIDPDGRALRAGAEGLLARRTELPVSSIGGQHLIDDAEVQDLRRARRDDLPGRPLVWQAALSRLVEELTGRRVPGRTVAAARPTGPRTAGR